MTAMKEKIRIIGLHSQQGAALIIAVLILLILTVIGIYAVATSVLETKIAGSERVFKETFYAADSGGPLGVDLIKAIIHYIPSTIADLPAPWNDSGVIDNRLFDVGTAEIFTDDPNPTNRTLTWDTATDIDSAGDGTTPNLGLSGTVLLRVDIDRLGSHQISGGATEYGAGYEGIGQGGGGDVGIIYAIDSIGRYSFTNAESAIEAGYLYVVGVPGGE